MTYYHALYKGDEGHLLKYTNYGSEEELIDAIEKDEENIDNYIIIYTKTEIE